MSTFPTVAAPDHRFKVHMPAMPAPMQRMLANRMYFIFNVGPFHFTQCGGSVVIPACGEGESVSSPALWRGAPGIPELIPEPIVEGLEGRRVMYKWDFSTEGISVAQTALGIAPFMHESNDLRKLGVFMAAGPAPAEAEIEAATEAWHETCSNRVRAADQAYEINGGMIQGENGKSYSAITKDDVQAARVLGIDRPWARKQKAQTPCPACDRPVGAAAVRCHHEGCGAILDEKRARKMFPHLYAQPKAEVA